MARSFTVENLAEGVVPQVLPLLRATWPKLDLASWEEFAAHFCASSASDAAIMIMRDSSGGMCGLFASHVERRLAGGRTLAIPLFTAIDIGNSPEPARALLNAAETIGKKHGCQSLEIRLGRGQDDLSKRLRRLGLEFAETIGSRRIATAPDGEQTDFSAASS